MNQYATQIILKITYMRKFLSAFQEGWLIGVGVVVDEHALSHEIMQTIEFAIWWWGKGFNTMAEKYGG